MSRVAPRKIRSRFLAAISKCILLICLLFLFPVSTLFLPLDRPNSQVLAATTAPCATPGKDGPGGSLAGIINTYYPPLSATTTLSSGATSLQVGAPVGAATPIGLGDLLLIIQMQDSTIEASNTDAYGNGQGGDTLPYGTTPFNVPPSTGASGVVSTNAGKYEHVTVTSISGSTIGIQGTGTGNGLINTYTNAPASATKGQSTYQIIRVPQYSSATLGNATALPWNGSVGGILTYDITGNLTLTGTVDVSGRGFRGGAGRRLSGAGSSTTYTNTDYRTPATVNTNGSKGEGIAGTPRYVLQTFTAAGAPAAPTVLDTGVEGYPNGSYGRGAPGNAGGGSTDGRPTNNDQNSGGGGGANGGNGGLGGRAWSSQLPSGGFGGKAFAATSDRLVLGGGAGAGTTNDGSYYTGSSAPTGGDGSYSSGAAGGGMVMIRTNSVSGTGTILARGATPRDVGQDGAGGGGAGGSVFVSTRPGSGNSLAGLTVDVRGGDGGWARFSAAHGPGGGGGGGVIVNSLPGLSVGSLAGGVGGRTGTTGNLGNFDAAAGTGLVQPLIASAVPGIKSGAECAANLTVVKTTSTPTISSPAGGGKTATYTITVSNGVNQAAATQVTIADPALPSGFTYASTSSIVLNGGATRTSVSDPSVGSTTPSWGAFTIPGGAQVQITFVAAIATGVLPGTYQNPANAQYLDPARTTSTGTATVTYNPSSSPGEDVTIANSNPKVVLVKRITRINTTDITTIVDDSNSSDDDPANWISNTFLQGVINGGKVSPEEELEYTIYFRSAGDTIANNVLLCDRVPQNVTFLPTAFNSFATKATGGLPTADRGIQWLYNGQTQSLTNVSDGDAAQYFPPGTDPVSVYPKVNCGGANTNGAVVVNLGNLPHATAPGTPAGSYGFVRFRGRVK